jgi:adhesin/invasin
MRVFRGILTAALLGAVAACEDSNEPLRPANVAPVTPFPASAAAGSPQNVAVKVTTSNGTAVPNVTVTFAAGANSGNVAPASSRTDANGVATAIWILGTTPGTNTLTVTPAGLTATTYTINATAGAAARIEPTSNTLLTGPAGGAVTTRPAVVVRDANNNPVSGATVTFSVVNGGGSVTGGTVTTDASGVATVGGITLGPIAGPNLIQAAVLAAGVTGNPVNFTITGTPGAAATLAASAGNNQSGTAGGQAAVRPAIIVRDVNGNAVANVPVTFTVASGGGTITGGTQTTSAQGIATVGGFTFGTTAGPNTITVTAPGLDPVTLTLTGVAGPAAAATAQAGNNASASIGTVVTPSPSVLVRDANGNPVAGVTVLFDAFTGGGAVTGGTQTTNAQGIATVGSFRVGNTLGANMLIARIAGLPNVVFNINATAGAPANIAINAGSAQTAIAGAAPAIRPSVVVRDAEGNLVQGAIVVFTVASGGGTVTGGTATTNAQGIATVGNYTLGVTPGANTLTASIQNGQNVTFTFTGTQAPAASVAVLIGQGQTGPATVSLPINPAVIVRDVNGNPVAGVNVVFGIVGGGGTLERTQELTNAQGVASPGFWVLGPTPGPQVLSAVVQAANVAGNPVTFNATATAAPSPSPSRARAATTRTPTRATAKP